MKKIIPYILILAILIGLFSPLAQVQAATCTGNGQDAPDCTPGTGANGQFTNGNCNYAPGDPNTGTPSAATNSPCTNAVTGTSSTTTTSTVTDPNKNDLYGQLDSCSFILGGSLTGCVELVVYFVFVTIPSFLMSIVASMFDFVVALSISSHMYGLPFISTIWVVVRDFANIFFILILLYAAFQIILGLNEHGSKKIIGMVIIVALVVNFSLFFTRIVIDSSNIVALIFYNRIDTTDTASVPISDQNQLGVKEQPLSASLVSSFNINKFFSPTFLSTLQVPDISYLNATTIGTYLATGQIIPKQTMKVSLYLLVSMMVVYGLVVYALTYAFLMAGLSFFGRMINLMMLMIVSPFAFVTAAVPKFKSIDTIGFDSWIKKLLESSFVAAIFMFIIYIISQILSAQIFSSVINTSNTGVFPTLITLFVPAILIVILLLKGAKYAQKASGEFTAHVISGAKMVGGLAVGGTALGLAAAGRNTFGATAKYVQNDNARAKDLKLGTNLRNAVPKGWNKANPFAWAGAGVKAVTATKNFATAGVAEGIHATGLGKKMKNADEGYAHKTHATHILDAKVQSEFGHQYGKDAKYKDLSEHDQKIVKQEVDKDEMAKFVYGKLFKDLEAPQAAEIQGKYNGTSYIDPVTGATVAAGPAQRAISDDHGKTVRIDSAAAPLGTGEKLKSDYFVDAAAANAAIGEFVQALRKGSYDVRNLPDMSAKSKGFLPKLAVGLPSTAASLMRFAIKKGAGVEHYGAPQKDFLKDLKETISDSLKNAKISVSGGGGGHGGGGNHATEVKSVGH